ncbi:conjugal transfer relaxosome DNA-binding protein TraM, partial [Escherichia coli]|uniref:conjugal transfer relaxosome DNA-binding protein TraM n=1 Tax=Escherichia coli TaxID=562 RepID=UPI0038A951C3
MAKVTVYISNDAYEKINAIIEKRRQEGAREKDVSFSATASMLLDLWLRVHEAHMDRKESAFNQTD